MNSEIPLQNEKEAWQILAVDNDQAILQLLKRLLFPEYNVVSVSSGIEAVRLLRERQFNIIISNQKMPGVTGIELLKLAAEIQPQAIRIILTGYADVEKVKPEIENGNIYKQIIKPWNDENLKMIVAQAAEYYEIKD